ncbi:MAG: RNA polymerase sigma factor [Phycisphaerales bacterium]|nr:RNA polymerase sigma factor [Phycisphaerales bacterium]
MVPVLSVYSSLPNTEPEELSNIVALAADGDESAWEQLVGLYSRRVFAMARSRLHDEELAEEITQSVFVTIATKLNSSGYTEQNRFEPWLFRITMNRVRDYCRKRARHAKPTDPEHFAGVRGKPDADVHEADNARKQLESLRSAMEQLSDSDREIIELRHHGQLSFKQIAEMSGDPIGTLLARHHRALKKLRSIIESEQSPEDAS